MSVLRALSELWQCRLEVLGGVAGGRVDDMLVDCQPVVTVAVLFLRIRLGMYHRRACDFEQPLQSVAADGFERRLSLSFTDDEQSSGILETATFGFRSGSL